MKPHEGQARALVAHLTEALFALDHEQQTARFTVRIHAETHTTPYFGINAEIQPWAYNIPDHSLIGRELRLLEPPYRDVVYRIVGREPDAIDQVVR